MVQAIDNETGKRLQSARRIVVKLGTRVVGEAKGERIDNLVDSLAALKKSGRQIVLVSSGAVGLGAARLGLDQARLKDVTMRQACAAVGQSLLMNAYEQHFAAHQITPAQVLLTESDFTDHRRYLNLRRTMEKLLKLGVLPIINENDTVSTAELEYLQTGARVFSDNDRLAALVMSKLEADALVLLTNVDGLLDNHGAEGERSVIPFVSEVTPELKRLASGPSAGGRGGMLTKLEAAEIAMQSGGVAVIANGTRPDTLTRIFAGENTGTVFMSDSRMPGKKRWIAYAAGVHGRVIVNDGAREAILNGKASLLSSGLIRIEDSFEAHDVLIIADAAGREFARGIANFDSREAEAEAQRAKSQSPASASTTREKQRVLVTRDNIVVLESAKSAEAV